MQGDFQLEPTMIVGGAIGSTATALANRSPDSWMRKVSDWLCGALVGIFVGPALVTYFNVQERHFQTAICFAVGAAGLILIGVFLDIVKSEKFRTWLSKKFAP